MNFVKTQMRFRGQIIVASHSGLAEPQMHCGKNKGRKRVMAKPACLINPHTNHTQVEK